MKHAVRRALKADFDLADVDYKLALHRHGDKMYFCELSDVDGIPIDQALIDEFTRLYRDAQDEACVPKTIPHPADHSHPVTWILERIRKQAAELRRMDSGVGMNPLANCPQLVSKFSWGSDTDEEAKDRKRLTQMKR
jgi:nucleotidyltransferase/DNA polymerase involved in DNA repair